MVNSRCAKQMLRLHADAECAPQNPGHALFRGYMFQVLSPIMGAYNQITLKHRFPYDHRN